MITKSRVRPRKVEEETTQMDFKLTQKEKEAALLLMQLSCDSESRSGGTSGGGGGGGGDRRKGLEEINEVIEKEESVGDNSGEICSRKKEMNLVRKKKKFRYLVDLYNETKPLGLRKHGKK